MQVNIRKFLGLPTKSNELTYWGISDFKAGEYGSALKFLNRALELDPNNEFIKEKIQETIDAIESKNVKMFSDINFEYSQESSKDVGNADYTCITSSSLDNTKLSWQQETYINLDESQKKHEKKLSAI